MESARKAFLADDSYPGKSPLVGGREVVEKNSYQEDWRSFFMSDHYIAFIIGLLVFLGSLVSVETGISVALIEITLGVIGGNFLKVSPISVFPSFRVL